MSNPNRHYDKSHLSIDQAEERGFVHRDYIAHCFRWSHVVKTLMSRHQYKGAHILDVGCGKDQPLPRLLYSNKMTGFKYTGIDMNSMDFHPTLAKAHANGKVEVGLMEQTDSSIVLPEELPWGKADFLVAFEILEHIQPYICRRMIKSWKEQVHENGILFVSTPVYNGSAAANHINEMGRKTLGKAFESMGFTILGNYGTFASKSDMYPNMTEEHKSVYDKLREYYDSNVLSTIFAPMYPQGSRNNLWVLRNSFTPAGEDMFLGWKLDENQNANILDLFRDAPKTD